MWFAVERNPKTTLWKPEDRAPGGLTWAVTVVAEEFEQTEVREDLELLADFVGDVGIVGVG